MGQELRTTLVQVFYGPTDNHRVSIPMGSLSTVLLAEVMSILRYTKLLMSKIVTRRIIQGTTHKSMKFECCEKITYSAVVCHYILRAVPFVNQTAKRRCAVWSCVLFLCIFLDFMLVLICDCTDVLKWLMWRSNRFASNFASNAARWQSFGIWS